MIYKYKDLLPKIDETVFIAPSADIIGDVTIGRYSSVWFNVTIRGDVHYIKIGSETNIQDNSVLHVTNGMYALNIADKVTVGHGVALHGCTIGNNVLVGMRATVLDGANIGDNSIIAAGSLVREGYSFPPGVLIAGNPAQIKRDLTDQEKNKNLRYAGNYVEYSKSYLQKGNFKLNNS